MARKIIVHAGTEKTGTTSLQLFLDDHRDALLSRGVYYPETGHDYRRSGRFPKHNWLLEGLMADDGAALRLGFERVLGQCPPRARTVVLSDEALFGDWQHTSPGGRAALAALAATLEIELWVWFRDPVAYARSLYVQILENPGSPSLADGGDFTLEAALDFPTFSGRLDYVGYVRKVEAVLGAGRVRPFVYRGDTTSAFLHALGVGDLEAARPRENRTVGQAGVALLQILGRYDLDADQKVAAVSLIGALDDLLAGQSPPLAVTPETEERIRALAAPSLAALAQDYGLLFEAE
jgi:hypothetical protein